jgi:hypothetical protein
VAPGFAGAQVDDDDAVAALDGGIRDVGDAAAGRGARGTEVDADVVEVAVGVGDVGGEDDGLEDAVGGEVDAEEFGPAGRGGRERAVGGQGAPRVEDPGAVGRVDDDGLGADDVRGVVGTRGRVGRVVDAAAGGVVDFGAGPGSLAVVGEELGDGVFVVGAVVGVVCVEARGVVGEFPSRLADGDACRRCLSVSSFWAVWPGILTSRELVVV